MKNNSSVSEFPFVRFLNLLFKYLNMDRVDIIKTVVLQKKAKTYLEIGVNDGFTFLKVPVWKKLGVDPSFRLRKRTILKYIVKNPTNITNRYYSLTSDDFFNLKAKEDLYKKVDVAFIDGLHTFEQSLKDVENTLPFLMENGVIIMHDCSPPDEASAYPSKTLEEARQANIPGWSGNWCGNVWKTIPYLRSVNKQINIFVLDCDFGVGIITKGKPEKDLNISKQQALELTYSDLENNREELLNLKCPEYLYDFLKLI